MRNKAILTTVLSMFAFSGVAIAQVGSGTLGVTATVVGTLNLTFITDAAGMAVTGTGTATASMPFGNVQMFGGAAVPGLTQTVNGVASFTISTPVDIRADLSNSPSAELHFGGHPHHAGCCQRVDGRRSQYLDRSHYDHSRHRRICDQYSLRFRPHDTGHRGGRADYEHYQLHSDC